MGRYRDMLISSKAISFSKFNKLCVRTEAFIGRTEILNFIVHVQGFSFFFQNNIKLIEMISVYFNRTLDGYYQDELGSSNCFDFLLSQGKKFQVKFF